MRKRCGWNRKFGTLQAFSPCPEPRIITKILTSSQEVSPGSLVAAMTVTCVYRVRVLARPTANGRKSASLMEYMGRTDGTWETNNPRLYRDATISCLRRGAWPSMQNEFQMTDGNNLHPPFSIRLTSIR